MILQTKRSQYRCSIHWGETDVRVVVKEPFLWLFWKKVWEMETNEFENYTGADRELNCYLAVSQYEKHLQKTAMEKNEAVP